MRKLQVVALAAGMMLLAGCGNKAAENANDTGSAQKQEVKNEAQEQKGGIISSIKDAIGMGQTMKCTYTIKAENETFVSTVYVNGEKYMGESEIGGKKMKSVFDGEAFYMWDETEKKGTKMEKKCMEELDQENKKAETNQPAPDQKFEDKFSADDAFKDAMDVKCEPASGIDFSAPKDVKFEDMCQMLKDMQEKFKNFKVPEGQLPPGGNPGQIPGGGVPPMPDAGLSE